MTIFPLWVHKLTLRLLQLVKASPFVSVHLFKIDGVWYMQTGAGEPERLGEG